MLGELLDLLNALRGEFPDERFVLDPRFDPEEGDEYVLLIVETKLDTTDAIERMDHITESRALADFGSDPRLVVTLGFV